MKKFCPKCFKKYSPSVVKCPDDGSYLVSSMDRDLTGEVLDDRYTVMERIGRGGMGIVYRAEQHLLKRVVALKVLRREIVQDESAVKRFLTEAQSIASLDSRHTVTLYDFGVTSDGLLYYTMELLKGQPLSGVIKKEAPLDPYRAARLIMQACDSLEEAHEHGILHRDLKPDNLYVIEKRRKEHVKVLDFGIAKLIGDTSMDSVTRTGMIIGTPQYLSPEQALGNPVVFASDLYSLGIVLYEMLSGHPPFLAETPMKTMWAHIREPVPSLTEKNPRVQVPRSIELFLQKALEKDPGSRFQTTATFRSSLRRALEDHDATPETVVLSPLATTDEGLRLKTQVLETARPSETPRDPPARPGKPQEEPRDTALLGSEFTSGRPPPVRTAKESPPRPARPVPARVSSGQSASNIALSHHAELESESEISREDIPGTLGGQPEHVRQPDLSPPSEDLKEPSVPDDAGFVPAPVDEPLPDGAVLSAPSPEPLEAIRDAMGPETLSIAMPFRNRLPWIAGIVGVLAVVAVLLVWRLWPVADPVDSSTERPVQAGTGRSDEPENASPEEDRKQREEVAEAETIRDGEDDEKENADLEDGGQKSNVQEAVKACVPSCDGKTCGDDGCSGSCGECNQYPGSHCTGESTCTCRKECGGKKCGDDACGGLCGECSPHPGSYCAADGICGCKQDCVGRDCGGDGCGGSCGMCDKHPGSYCTEDRTCACKPNCDGRKCGDDDCGGSCGKCRANEVCSDGKCVCQAKCGGRECGSDGCGGSCGSCLSDTKCLRHKCVTQASALLSEGSELMKQGQYEKAMDVFRQAQDRGASSSTVDALIRKCVDKIRGRECRKLEKGGDRAHREKNWGECVKLFETAESLSCGAVDAQVKLDKCRKMNRLR